MYDLPDTEIVEAALSTNVGEEFPERAFVAIFRLDIEMSINLPAVDVVQDVIRGAQSLEDSNLLKFRQSITRTLEWTTTLLDRESRSRGWTAGRCPTA